MKMLLLKVILFLDWRILCFYYNFFFDLILLCLYKIRNFFMATFYINNYTFDLGIHRHKNVK